MMKKAMIFVLCAASVIALTACGGNSATSSKTSSASTTSTTSAKDTSGEEKSVERLGFLADGEMFLDINVKEETVSGLFVIANGQKVGADKKLKATKDTTFAVQGNGSEDAEVILLSVVEKKEGDEYRATTTCSKVGADAIVDLLSKKLPNWAGEKIYIAVIDENTGWDHSLSEALNAYIEQQLTTYKF